MEYIHHKCNKCGYVWDSEYEENYCPMCNGQSIEKHLREE